MEGSSGYLLGIDGGQTSVRCVVATLDGTVIGKGVAEGLTHLAAVGSEERFVRNVSMAVRRAFVAAGFADIQPVVAAGLGLTGVSAGTPEADMVRRLMNRIVHANDLIIENDAHTALLGAFAGAPGVIAISGTGSIVMGLNDAGQRARVGGWGWLVGDEGSAVAIGRAGLRAALAAWDHSGPRTALTPLLLAHFSITDFADVKRLVHSTEFGSAGFAALAASASAASKQNDMIAQRIIREEAIALAANVVAVARRLNLIPAQTLISVLGGAFENVFNLREEFIHALAILAPDARVVAAEGTALDGSLQMAKQLAEAAQS